MSRICLLTPGQPSTNPRLVKEADALVDAGHEVHVLCAHYATWADAFDRELLGNRKWTCTYVGGKPGSLKYWGTRLRFGISRRLPALWRSGVRQWALTRVSLELYRAAVRLDAELYIAHYTGALVAAAAAAHHSRTRFAFDAEDFESGYYNYDKGPSAIDRLIENIEREYLPRCSYISAASPGIAEEYRVKYSIPLPTTLLNVFPTVERPPRLRSTDTSGPLLLYWFSQTVGLGRGLEDVISALARLDGCDIELHLRGFARVGDWHNLRRFARYSGVSLDRIILHEPLPSSEMIRAAANFDIGLALEQAVSKNRELCLTNKIFSYLLAGNAIVATETLGQRPIMDTIGKAGFIYEPGDVEALASGIRTWYENRGALHEARQQSWDWGTRRFNWDCEKKKFLQVVERALNKGTCATSVDR